MHVFVTGATGFIGKAVVKELVDGGHTVLGLSRSDEGAATLAALGADVHRGSLDDIESLKKGAAAADGVIHLAFGNDFSNFEANCKADREAITAMGEVLAGTNKPLVISSGTMMLADGRVGTEDDLPDFSNPLAAVRGQSETLAKDLAAEGVRTSIMRLAPTNHGDGDKGFMAILGGMAREKGFTAYVDDGASVWPAVHRLDTARAYRLALEKGTAGSTFHIAAEEGVKMKDIAEMLGKKLGLPAQSLSAAEIQAHLGFFGMVVGRDNPVSNKKTRSQLGWDPKECTLLEDLENGTYFQ